jgi:hypothetical protein
MKKLFVCLILFVLVCAFGFAQAVPIAPPGTGTAVVFLPQYYVGFGSTYDYYGATGFASNAQFGIRASSTLPLYSYTTMEFTSKKSTVRTGAAYVFYQVGNFNLIGLGDAGLSTGSGPTLGSFSGGGMLLYDVGARVTKGGQHFYVGGGGRMLQTATLGPQPVFEFTFGKGF